MKLLKEEWQSTNQQTLPDTAQYLDEISVAHKVTLVTYLAFFLIRSTRSTLVKCNRFGQGMTFCGIQLGYSRVDIKSQAFKYAAASNEV